MRTFLVANKNRNSKFWKVVCWGVIFLVLRTCLGFWLFALEEANVCGLLN